jgi:hypothetical protein
MLLAKKCVIFNWCNAVYLGAENDMFWADFINKVIRSRTVFSEFKVMLIGMDEHNHFIYGVTPY